MDTDSNKAKRKQLIVLVILIVIFVLMLLNGWLGLPLDGVTNGDGSTTSISGRSLIIWALGLVALLIGMWRMMEVFTQPLELEETGDLTGDLTGDPQRETRRDPRAIRRIISFGYLSMILALLLSFVLFMVPFLWTDSQRSFVQSPIGVLKGCRTYPERGGVSDGAMLEDPLACALHGPQWVLNIGGAVSPLRADLPGRGPSVEELEGQIGRLSERINGTSTQLLAALAAETSEDTENRIARLKAVATDLKSTKTRTKALEELDSLIQAADADLGTGPRPELALVGEMTESVSEMNGLITGLRDLAKNADLDQCSLDGRGLINCGVAISGGLVLPLFIVVFSLFGGAISMTRRLPEYQRRVTSAHHRRYARESAENPTLKPPMTPEEVREYVVFQIMQTMSAPLIAATVYSLMEPSNQASVVVIGFAAGFASEPILLQLRKLAERLGGEMEPPPYVPGRATHAGRAGVGDAERDRGRDQGRRDGRIARRRRERAEPSEEDAEGRDESEADAPSPPNPTPRADRSRRRPDGGSGSRRDRVRRRLEHTKSAPPPDAVETMP